MVDRADEPASLPLLTPLLELAVVVAQTGERASPPLTAPPLLRPFLHFTRRIPPPALRAARRVLEDDQTYRERVASVVTDELVGRAGVLFATRPEGWEDELAALSVASEESGATGPSKDDRKLERRLAGAEAATRRVEVRLTTLRVELAHAQSALVGERSTRAALESSLEEARRAKALLEEALAAVATRNQMAVDSVRGLQAELADAREELAVLRLERQARVGLEEAIRAALVAVEQVRNAVAATRVASDPDPLEPIIAANPPNRPRRPPTPPRIERMAPRTGRTPAPLPPAVFDDSTAAAHHLMRLSGALVLVDGYNVTKWKWTTLSPVEQRRRLIDVLEELAARTGAEFRVVFDGADDPFAAEPSVPQGGGLRARTVRVSFSPPRVDADDVILSAIEAVPLGRPVIVVSSDRRVRQGAGGRGANVLTSQQFVASWGTTGSLSYPSR